MPRSLLFLGTESTRDRATRIGVARILVGASMFQPIAVATHLSGIPDDESSGSVLFFARAFGIRNAVLGAWVLASRDRPKRYQRLVYRVNAAVDAADLAVMAISAIGHRVPKRLLALTALLGGNACLGFLELASEV